ncbi:MAG: DNA polymerase III subunit alpha, partial [Chlamydiia bacterium]|nr:DNA polymerase III subunit alpha [Chlamydiia bacterium]
METPPTVKHPTSPIHVLLREKELLGFFLTGHPLSLYESILARLSCVPLKQIPALDHDSVIRCSFVVETVATRIAQRSQKKFAILTVSDGLERYELPIWADMYESCSHLLNENQLLYAVLHVEKKDDELRLSCKWLNDLTKADDHMISDCDAAYDRAKLQVQRFALAKQRNEGKQQEKAGGAAVTKASEPKKQVMAVELGFDTIDLAELLQIKQILSQNPGPVAVRMGFRVKDAVNPVLHLDETQGIQPSEECIKALKQVKGVNGITLGVA